MNILFLLLVFVSVAALAFAAFRFFTGSGVGARLAAISGAESATTGRDASSPFADWLARLVRPASRLSMPDEGWEASPFRLRFVHAGLRGERVPHVFFGIKTVLTIGLPSIAMIVLGIAGLPTGFSTTMFILLFLAALGYFGPNVVLNRMIEARQRELFEAFPDAIDLMTVAVEAGLSLDTAIQRVGNEIAMRSRALAGEFRLLALELRAGATREFAMKNLATRTGVKEIELFVAMINQTDRFGTSVADSLRVHSEELRVKRRQHAEEQAAKIPTKLLFPLVLCIFPSLVEVLVGPAAINIYRTFFRISSGG